MLRVQTRTAVYLMGQLSTSWVSCLPHGSAAHLMGHHDCGPRIQQQKHCILTRTKGQVQCTPILHRRPGSVQSHPAPKARFSALPSCTKGYVQCTPILAIARQATYM